jgi:glycosyltransferase involved in cell wall biosynthesis
VAERASAPVFSVLIRAEGADSTLQATLRSVRRQIWRDREVIVVSTDRTNGVRRVVEQELPDAQVMRVRTEAGPGTAWNTALAASRGRHIAFLEHGDLWHTRYLHTCASIRAAAPDALFTFCDYYVAGSAKAGPVRQLQPIEAENALAQMLLRPFVHGLSTLTAPRAAVTAIGGLNATLTQYHQFDLPLRLLAGPDARRRLACEDRSAASIPQILVMLGVRPGAGQGSRPAGAPGNVRWFLDCVFGYDFMARYAALRRRCEMQLQAFASELSTGNLALP